MESYFEKLKKELYIKADKIVNGSAMFKALRTGEKFDVDIPKDFEEEFFKLIDKVNLSLMEENIKNSNDQDVYHINRFIEFLKEYPVDLMVGIMKDMKNGYPESYKRALENEEFVESYFEAYSAIRG